MIPKLDLRKIKTKEKNCFSCSNAKANNTARAHMREEKREKRNILTACERVCNEEKIQNGASGLKKTICHVLQLCSFLGRFSVYELATNLKPVFSIQKGRSNIVFLF